MAGTKIGGIKATKTIYSKHGLDFFRRVGAIGGKKGKTGGFASLKVGVDGLTGRQRAELAGAKGGKKSRRRKAE